MKRRCESSPLREPPIEKKKKKKKKETTCGSVCDAEREVETLHAAVTGPRRRKRPRSTAEEEEEHGVTEEARNGGQRDTTHRGVKHTANGDKEMTSEEIKADDVKRTKAQYPDEDTKDDLSAFNSFQFWRSPLPALDLSLLDATSAPAPAHAEDMET